MIGMDSRCCFIRVHTYLESPGISLVGESPGILWMISANDVYRQSCVTLLLFLLRKMKIHIRCML